MRTVLRSQTRIDLAFDARIARHRSPQDLITQITSLRNIHPASHRMKPTTAPRKAPATRCRRYRFFHPPRCPGAPPVERGAGPNSGPDWRESVGWKILLPLRGAESSCDGLRVS